MSGDNVEVAIRVRPLIPREVKNKDLIKWQVKDNIIFPTDPLDARSDVYQFDHIFGIESTNEDLYNNVVAPLVLTCIKGYHCTIFTYGQTSSGKTHTMDGTKSDPGIIPRVVTQLFDIINVRRDSKFLVRVAYIEIYNEKIYDLLKKDNVDVKLREDSDGNILILSEELVTSTKEQILEVMKVGKKNRKIYSTNMNIKSSRSHTIFRIIVENCGKSEDGIPHPVRVSHFNLVDLAGSERVAQTKATGQRLVEGAAINKSLSTLTLVISQLTDESCKFRSYRDSKLTLILKNALGGNAKTLIVANITPASVEDTHSTLLFARRAKNIKNQPMINTPGEDSILLQQQLRIKELEQELLIAQKDKRQIYNELIKLNQKAFAKGSVSDAQIKRRHTISKTRDVESASEIENIVQVSTSVIPLTQFEKSLLRVARTNAIECTQSSEANTDIQVLPFEAQLDLSINNEAECSKQATRSVSPNISILDYSVCDVDLIESDDDDAHQEFIQLEEMNKSFDKDLQKEIEKLRTDASSMSQQYAQQIALNIYLRDSNKVLLDNLIAAKDTISNYEKQTAFEMYNSAKDKMTKEINELHKELEEEKMRYTELRQELNVNQEEYFQLLKDNVLLKSQLAELKTTINDGPSKQSENIEQPVLIQETIDEPSTSSDKTESDATKINNLEVDLFRANQEITILRQQFHRLVPEESSRMVFEKVCNNQMSLEKMINDNIRKGDDIRSLNRKIEEILKENMTLERNLQQSEDQKIKQQTLIDDLVQENLLKIHELKSMRINLEKAEDDLLDLSQNLDSYEKRMSQVLKQNKLSQSLVKFMETYYKFKLNELKKILSTMKTEDSKKISDGLFRVKSLPNIVKFGKDANKPFTISCFGSLHNINVCVHEQTESFKEISEDLMSLSQVLSRGPATTKNIEMEESLHIAKNRIDTLQSQVERYLLDVESTNDVNSHLKQRIRDLEDEMNQMQQLTKDEIAILKNQIKNSDEKYKEMAKSYEDSFEKEISWGKKYAAKVEEYKELERKYAELNDAIEDIQNTSELETLKKSEENVQMESEYKVIKNNYEKLKTLFENNQAEIRKLEMVKKQLENNVDEKISFISRLQSSNSAVTKENKELNEKVNKLNELETQNIDLLTKLESAEILIQTKTSMLESNLSLSQQLQATVSRLQIELTQATTSTQTEINQNIEKLAKENADLIDRLNTLHYSVDEKTQSITKLQVENTDLRNNFSVYKKEVQSLIQQNKQLRHNCNEIENISQQRFKTCNQLQREIDDLRMADKTRSHQHENKMHKYEQDILDLTEKLSSLKSASDTKYRMISQYQSKMSDLNKENEKLRLELNNLIGVNEKLREKNWEQQVQAESYEKQINALLDKNQELERCVAGIEQKKNCLSKENQELRVRLQQTEEAYEKRYNLLVAENRQLLKQNKNSQEDVEKYNKLLCERDNYMLNLKSAHDSNKTFRKQLEREKMDLINKLQSCEILINEQEIVINNLRSEIQKLSADNDKFQRQIRARSPEQRIEFKIKKYMRRVNELEEEKNSLIQTVNSLENVTKQKEKYLQSSLDQKKELEEREKQLLEHKKQLYQQLKDEQKAKEHLAVEVEQLRSELHSSNKELRRYKQRCECESPSTSMGVVEPWKTKRRVAQDTQREKEHGKETDCAGCKKLEMKIFNMECERITPKEDTFGDMYYQSKLEVCDRQIKDLRQNQDKLELELKEVENERSSLMAELADRDQLLLENKKIHEKYKQLKAVAVRRNEEILNLRSQLHKK